jgi:hypothetical protein
MSSAGLVKTNCSHCSFQPSIKVSIALMRSFTDVKVPPRMAWRVMIPKKISTRFSQEPEVGVNAAVQRCSVGRDGLLAYQMTP